MKRIYIIICISILTCAAKLTRAQVNPLLSQYYNNLYLANPAFAGVNSGLNLNLAFRSQWGNLPGAPVVQNFTADYGTGKVGLGLNVNFDRAGLQRQSRVVGTYAYHLPLNTNGQTLHFGLSFGFMNQRLSTSDLQGNQNDTQVGLYNSRQTYFDGDFGVAYTSNSLKLEASLPNMKNFFKKDVIKLADVNTFYAAASYNIQFNSGADGFDVEPKVAYRGIRNYDSIIDAGLQVSFAQKQVMLIGMYHSSKSASFGLGLNYKKRYLITGAYTTQTSALSNYTNGSFEINLGLGI